MFSDYEQSARALSNYVKYDVYFDGDEFAFFMQYGDSMVYKVGSADMDFTELVENVGKCAYALSQDLKRGLTR